MSSDLLILDAGEQRVLAAGDLSEVYRMPIAEVVEAAGVTRGAFTHHWPTRHDFEVDLLHHLAVGVRSRARQRLSSSLESVLDAAARVSFDEVFGAAMARAIEAVAFGPDFPIMVGLWSASMTDPNLAGPLAGAWADIDDSLTDQLRLLLAVFRVRLKPDADPKMLAAGLVSVVQGYAIRVRVSGDTDTFTSEERSRQLRAMFAAYVDPV